MAENPSAHSDELEAIATEANVLTHLLCFICERHFEQFSEATTADVDAWSHDVAARALRAGWRFRDGKIYCPGCWSTRD
jgi:hypothetical protein